MDCRLFPSLENSISANAQKKMKNARSAKIPASFVDYMRHILLNYCISVVLFRKNWSMKCRLSSIVENCAYERSVLLRRTESTMTIYTSVPKFDPKCWSLIFEVYICRTESIASVNIASEFPSYARTIILAGTLCAPRARCRFGFYFYVYSKIMYRSARNEIPNLLL